MLSRLIPVRKDLRFERTYPADRGRVWAAWTEPELLRQWWGPDKTTVPECEVDLRVGGEVRIVMEAGPAMGRYAGTRWPMVGEITDLDPLARLRLDARSWTEGQEEATLIRHVNDLTLADGPDGTTVMRLHIAIASLGPEAKLAAFGMKWGYQQQFTKLGDLLAGPTA